MRYVGLLLCATAVLVAVYASPAAGHHSFAAEFDRAKPITLTGKVSKVEWTNPHAFFHIDVKDEKTGEVVNWAAELNSPNSLMRLGWTRDSLKTDDIVTVQGSLARDGSKLLNAQSVVLTESKKRIFTVPAEGAGQ